MNEITLKLDKTHLHKLHIEMGRRNRNLENTILDMILEIREKHLKIYEYELFVSDDCVKFKEWSDNIKFDNLLYLSPIKNTDLDRLLALYDLDVICDLLIKMENYGAKIRKYKSLFLVLKTWLKNVKTKTIHQ